MFWSVLCESFFKNKLWYLIWFEEISVINYIFKMEIVYGLNESNRNNLVQTYRCYKEILCNSRRIIPLRDFLAYVIKSRAFVRNGGKHFSFAMHEKCTKRIRLQRLKDWMQLIKYSCPTALDAPLIYEDCAFIAHRWNYLPET